MERLRAATSVFFRSRRGAGWSYKDFGPFVFERVSYIAEVDKYLAREDARLHSAGSRRLTYDERMELAERIMSDDDWDE